MSRFEIGILTLGWLRRRRKVDGRVSYSGASGLTVGLLLAPNLGVVVKLVYFSGDRMQELTRVS